MRMTRRTFVKGSAATGGLILASQFIDGGLLTLAASEPGDGTAIVGEEWVPTTCWIGKQDCGMIARKINGRVVKFEGHKGHPRNRGTLCPKGVAQIQAVYDPNRVQTPLVRTNGKGKPGEFRPASWEDALTLVATAMNDARKKDPRLLIWQKGRSKAKSFYDTAFVKTTGATKLHHGAFCSDAAYRACEYTIGFHGGLHPDFRHTNYLLSLGWGMVTAGGNKTCQITWIQQYVEARERGMKMIALDPSRRNTGPFADEWLPIRPSTDMAFFLALCNVLVENGYLDREYLTKHTNSPFLVSADGTFLRVDGKEQVWDLAGGAAVPVDTEGAEPALEGSFTVDGQPVKTAFELFKQHVLQYTPEWAASICDLNAAQIRQVALDFGEAARIGSTIVIDGVTLPYRPVGLMGYHVSQQELGFQMLRSSMLPFMLVGAIEAVGGLRSDTSRKLHDNFTKLDEIEIDEGPYNVYLKDSKYFPINSNNSSIAAQAMLDPGKWDVDYVPEVAIVHMANPVLSFPDQEAVMAAYEKFKFVAVIDPWLSETADYYADVVLPAATIEKYEGPLGVMDQYTDATTLRVPPMAPLFQSKGEIEIYIELCEKAELLYGDGGYIDQVNTALKLDDPYKMPLDVKPDVRDIFDRWAKSAGYEDGVRFFETVGVSTKPIATEKLYAPAWDPPYGGIRHRLYGESLQGYGERMKEMGVGPIYYRQYTALPTWMEPTMEGSPDEYDLYLITRKHIEHKQSRTTFVPILNELMPDQGLEINPATARKRDIEDGDEVVVWSHNAVTDETRSIRTRANYLESIRPDTVSLSHHFGFWTNPITEGQGPTPNTIFYSGEGYVSNTADQSFQVKVRVSK